MEDWPVENRPDYTSFNLALQVLQDVRYYSVWRVRQQPGYKGIHVGVGRSGYHALMAIAGNQNHIGGIAFKMCLSLEDALDLYHEERERRGAPPTPGFWYWP